MRFEPCDLDAPSWNELLARFPRANLLQSWEYGAAKQATSAWAVERGFIYDGADRVGMAQAMIRSLPLRMGGFAWINRAPVCEDAGTRDAISALVSFFGKERGYYVRLAPPIEAAPQIDDPAAANFRSTEIKGWASARLDLTRSEDDLSRGLRSNWRNSLRKAEKSGITIEIGDDETLFGRFLALHRSFIADRNFSTSMTPSFLQALQTILPASRKLTVLAASHGSELLGTVLIARFGASCEYWAGNTSGRQAGVGVGQLLLWRAIVEMKRLGYTSFDLGGMDPDLTPSGIYAFKAGVNPTPYRQINEIEANRHTMMQKLVRAYVARKR